MEHLDKIIGYEGIKTELRKIIDMLHNPNKYKALGANLPRGILLHGEPGVGKTLMANCLIQASGRISFTCRKNKPDGEFVNEIRETFRKASDNQPSIVFLDDMDKFSNEDKFNSNAEEYVTIQTCMDEIKDLDVLVVATANCTFVLPESLTREGRFDIKFEISNPKGEDAKNIIKFYMDQKKFIANIDYDEVAKFLNGYSCAELETLINKAGVIAGFKNKEQIDMEDLIESYTQNCFLAPESAISKTPEQLEKIAYHEAGHALVAELLQPGSVALVSIANHMGNVGGFTSYFQTDDYWTDITYMENKILTLLAGKAIIELKYNKLETGAYDDLERAFKIALRIVSNYAAFGFEGFLLSHKENTNYSKEHANIKTAQLLNEYYSRCKEILHKNMHLADKIAQSLLEKQALCNKELANLIR